MGKRGNKISRRTWQMVMDELIPTNNSANQVRWLSCAKSRQFEAIPPLALLTTRAGFQT